MERRTQFGTRYLKSESDIFKHNAWDNVEWSEEQHAEAEAKVREQELTAVRNEVAEGLLNRAPELWDAFYSKHRDRFFMNRNWLLTEFPELSIEKKGNGKPLRVLEVGCGVGNTTFPLLSSCERGSIFVYCCDYSSKAVEIVRGNTSYDEDHCCAFVWDITDEATKEIPDESLDVVLCIFVLSAIPPEKQQRAVDNLTRLLRPGGVLLLKDYGEFDLTQLRFKKNRLIRKRLYCRGDGTLVYFFTQDELDSLFTNAGLVKEINILDRRLIVNRAKLVKMYRIWIQCKYVKPAR